MKPLACSYKYTAIKLYNNSGPSLSSAANLLCELNIQQQQNKNLTNSNGSPNLKWDFLLGPLEAENNPISYCSSFMYPIEPHQRKEAPLACQLEPTCGRLPIASRENGYQVGQSPPHSDAWEELTVVCTHIIDNQVSSRGLALGQLQLCTWDIWVGWISILQWHASLVVVGVIIVIVIVTFLSSSWRIVWA